MRTTVEQMAEENPPPGNLAKCPHCEYILLERTAYCPFCGVQLTHPWWKKAGAWLGLMLIAWILFKCSVRMLDGFD